MEVVRQQLKNGSHTHGGEEGEALFLLQSMPPPQMYLYYMELQEESIMWSYQHPSIGWTRDIWGMI